MRALIGSFLVLCFVNRPASAHHYFDEGLGLIILITLLGMFFFSVMPIVTAATMDRVPKGSEGSGTALNFIGMSLIGFMAPIFAGFIYSRYNFSGISIMSGIIAVSGIILCSLLPMKKLKNS